MIHNADRILGLLSLTPCTINEMARRLTINRNTVAATVNRMCAKGLIAIWQCVRGTNGRPAYRYGKKWL